MHSVLMLLKVVVRLIIHRYAPPAHLLRTIVQLPHKFFKSIRDWGLGKLTVVATRLPKNF
jgi:hypothetical protein